MSWFTGCCPRTRGDVARLTDMEKSGPICSSLVMIGSLVSDPRRPF